MSSDDEFRCAGIAGLKLSDSNTVRRPRDRGELRGWYNYYISMTVAKLIDCCVTRYQSHNLHVIDRNLYDVMTKYAISSLLVLQMYRQLKMPNEAQTSFRIGSSKERLCGKRRCCRIESRDLNSDAEVKFSHSNPIYVCFFQFPDLSRSQRLSFSSPCVNRDSTKRIICSLIDCFSLISIVTSFLLCYNRGYRNAR
jgi:hypothetical protein